MHIDFKGPKLLYHTNFTVQHIVTKYCFQNTSPKTITASTAHSLLTNKLTPFMLLNIHEGKVCRGLTHGSAVYRSKVVKKSNRLFHI